MVSSLQNIDITFNSEFARYQANNNQFAPHINGGDFLFIDRKDTNLTDGSIYLFSHKKEDKQLIRKTTYTLAEELRLSTPTDSEIIDSEVFLSSYICFGRVCKRVAIIEEEL